ncbi:conserved hypothetical protein [Colwellia chukchiensis]|uniref:Purine nucleoside phosphorylase n=1 Tax=Colwellia chukchiensis TaxID=641665 RepID=A0A1H7FUN4_9GAMM|nr:conserved hypothetical protein [Colwellia chukchiensis]
MLAFSTTRLFPVENNTTLDLKNSFCNAKQRPERMEKFASFNLGDHVGDNPDAVAANRVLLHKLLPASTKIQWLEQVHGNHVIEVDAQHNKALVADASVTRKQGIALAVLTADCLPILLTNRDGTEVAAIHAGWRPLAGNIIQHTVAKMQSKAEHIYAWLGPCIGPQAFEVGEEVKQAFSRLAQQLTVAFTPRLEACVAANEKKYGADLQQIAKLQLMALGIHNVVNMPKCTFQHATQYYSYRRDGQTGRMASIICIKANA